MKIKVAVLQYDVPDTSEAEYQKLAEMTSHAAWSGAKLVVAPETALGELAEVSNIDANRKSEIIKIAKGNKVFLCTSFYIKEKDKIYNQGYIVDDEGKVVLDHKKIYLAPPEKDQNISAGNTLKVIDTKIGRLGMLICKDGFNKYSNALYQEFNGLGVEIICVPTWSIGWKNNIGSEEYVKTLYTYGSLISRAYVLVSGNLNKSTDSFGRSLIISPINGVMQEASRDKREILLQEVDLLEVQRIREFDLWWQPKQEIKINE